MMFYQSEEEIKREKRNAREVRHSQWWKRRIAKGTCHYCGAQEKPADLTMDHVIPIARGGKSSKGNLVPACKACNTNKQSMLPLEWEQHLRDQGFKEDFF